MNEGENEYATVKTTETLFAILQGLQELDRAGVTELAGHLGIAKSTVHRHCKTLAEHGYAVRYDDEYALGLKFLEYGEYARSQNTIYQQVRPLIQEIADITEERSLFITEEHGRAVYIYRSTGEHAVNTDSSVGTRRPIHTVAGGKAILAHLPEYRVDAIIEQWGLPGQTENTFTSREELFQELEDIRERGFAFNHEECIPGLKAVAAPVLGSSGEIYGALSASGPAHRMKGKRFESEIPDLLLGKANELVLNIKYTE